MQRRDFLFDVARLAAMCAAVPTDWRVVLRPRWADDPFQLGVASGDPMSTAVMIWTRLAPKPLEPDGGMNGLRVGVNWEVADDEAFSRVVKRGRATAAPELSYSLHVDVDGLAPDRWYFYRFTTADASSPVGRLRTTPAAGVATPLRFAFNSCQHWEQGLYTALQHLSREEIDLCAHLGDYIYEYGPTPGRVRLHNSTEIRTLDHYRARYALYKSDPMLQQAHARCPWIVTWDDHEVDNNYASEVGENQMESNEQMRARRAAAYQAWWEHQPVRAPRVRSWADLNIVRSVDWGALTRFWMLDSRQFRSDQVCGDINNAKVPCDAWADPGRTMLGAAQERWLEQGMAASRARWQVLGNQTMLANVDWIPGADAGASMDAWAGYPAAQTRLLRTIATHAPNRTVVLTGDNHANWVNEIHTAGPAASPVATEFLGTSISSGGDGSDQLSTNAHTMMRENPHVKWHNNRRGYVVCEVTPDNWRAEFRTVPFVTKPDAPIETASTWRLMRGRPGIERE
ncbi:MAG: alkaline phosphatase D family protein [Gemmatimonadaceae bacterium]